MAIRILHGDVHLIDLQTRLPFKYGIATMTQAPQAFVRLVVEINGTQAGGVAADILQPDPAITGGITEVTRIASYASAHQLTLAPHLWGSAVLFAAGLHLAAALPNVVTLEYAMGFNPMLRELCSTGFKLSDSAVLIPSEPGLGVTINEEFVREYAVKTG